MQVQQLLRLVLELWEETNHAGEKNLQLMSRLIQNELAAQGRMLKSFLREAGKNQDMGNSDLKLPSGKLHGERRPQGDKNAKKIYKKSMTKKKITKHKRR